VFGSCRKWLIAGGVALCGVLAGPIGLAQASNASIVATFKAANPRLNADERNIQKAEGTYQLDHNAGPLIAAFRKEVRDIRPLNRALRAESASTSRGRRGKSDVTQGLTLIANAYTAIANDIQKAQSGQPVPPAMLNASVSSGRKGRAKLLAGLKLLGVKVAG
jgi:hypothetical protein